MSALFHCSGPHTQMGQQQQQQQQQQQHLDPVGQTCRITAGFRAVEQKYNRERPILVDPLAPSLAGEDALQLAEREWAALNAAQGPGNHLRVPARNRILDDELIRGLLTALRASGSAAAQVVNVGCGMDTRPWRLAFPQEVRYFDVDQPAVVRLKQQLLGQARAQQQQQQEEEEEEEALRQDARRGADLHHHALTCARYASVGADLLSQQQRLSEALAAAGFQRHLPTVWVAEALLYYLPLPKALELLTDMAGASAAGSCLLATVVDRELLVADQQLQEGHYFAKMWHFSVDELTAVGRAGEPSPLDRSGWRLASQPRTTAELAREWYGMGTYVPEYGGAECYFCADLQMDAPHDLGGPGVDPGPPLTRLVSPDGDPPPRRGAIFV